MTEFLEEAMRMLGFDAGLVTESIDYINIRDSVGG